MYLRPTFYGNWCSDGNRSMVAQVGAKGSTNTEIFSTPLVAKRRTQVSFSWHNLRAAIKPWVLPRVVALRRNWRGGLALFVRLLFANEYNFHFVPKKKKKKKTMSPPLLAKLFGRPMMVAHPTRPRRHTIRLNPRLHPDSRTNCCH
jgi:hypothetical protein